MKLTQEKSLAIMGLINKIASLQARYETAKNKSLEFESLVTKILNNAVKQLEAADTVISFYSLNIQFNDTYCFSS